MIYYNTLTLDESGFDIIDTLMESPIFDEYTTYDNILSENLMLSESQEIKLNVLREFSFKDVKTKILTALAKIKEFIAKIIRKIKYFLSSIGTDKLFKKIVSEFAKMSKEEREATISADLINLTPLENNVNMNSVKELSNLYGQLLVPLKDKKDAERQYSIRTDNGSGKLSVVFQNNLTLEEIKNKTSEKRSVILKNYIENDKKINQLIKNYQKLYDNFEKQRDKLEKIVNKLDEKNPEDFKGRISVIRSVAIPNLNTALKDINHDLSLAINVKKTIISKAIALIQNPDKKRELTDDLNKEDTVLNGKKVNESTDWSLLDTM